MAPMWVKYMRANLYNTAPIKKFMILQRLSKTIVFNVVLPWYVDKNILVQSATAYKFMTGGQPPKANMNKSDDVIVFNKEKDVSLEEMIKLKIIIAFQLKHGITKKEKYIKDKTYGVMVLNREKSIYDVLVRGIFQYLLSNEMPNEKPINPNRLLINGRILPQLRALMKINWENLPSNKPELSGTSCFRYFQS